jgi:thiol-disulfide isomerase/thioredoxin
MNRTRIAGTLALALALAVVVLAGTQGYAESLMQGLRGQGVGTAPKPLDPIEFELQDLKGKYIKLSGLKGKVVFLNFWATWCGPCRTEMPSMQRLYEQFKDQGLEILAVDLQEDKTRVQSFVKELGLTFTVLLDTKGTVGAQYTARAIPTTYLLDRQGFVFARTVGAREWDTPEMLELFRHILKDGVIYEGASSR